MVDKPTGQGAGDKTATSDAASSSSNPPTTTETSGQTTEMVDDLDGDPLIEVADDAGSTDAGTKETAEGSEDGEGEGSDDGGGVLGSGSTDDADAGDGDEGEEGDKGESDDAAGDDAAATPDLRAQAIERISANIAQQYKGKPAEIKKRTDALKNAIGRYKSDLDFVLAGWNAQQRIASGQQARVSQFPANGTTAQQNAWRKANNVPEKAASYDIPKVNGHQWTEADKPVLDSFKVMAHGLNLPQEVVNKVTSWYAQEQMKAIDTYNNTMSDRDAASNEEAEEAGIGKYGTRREYSRIIANVKSLLDGANGADNISVVPRDLGNLIRQARLPDGSYLGNNLDFVDFLHRTAEAFVGEQAFAAGDGAGAALNTRLAEITKVMREDTDRYYREGMDQEHMDILDRMNSGGRRRGARAQA